MTWEVWQATSRGGYRREHVYSRRWRARVVAWLMRQMYPPGSWYRDVRVRPEGTSPFDNA